MSKKEEIITFKVDEALAAALAGVENRSAFIRTAILESLGNRCPVCRGTGTLSSAQRRHWTRFLEHHHVKQCTSCNASILVCDHEEEVSR